VERLEGLKREEVGGEEHTMGCLRLPACTLFWLYSLLLDLNPIVSLNPVSVHNSLHSSLFFS
jgi:hypothetical protein